MYKVHVRLLFRSVQSSVGLINCLYTPTPGSLLSFLTSKWKTLKGYPLDEGNSGGVELGFLSSIDIAGHSLLTAKEVSHHLSSIVSSRHTSISNTQ